MKRSIDRGRAAPRRLGGVRAGGSAGGERDRRSLLPARRQRRLRRPPLRARTSTTRPRATGCAGVATIDATAKQALSSFNLDLVGLTVRSVKVGGRAARAGAARGGELTIVPRAALRPGRRFRTVIAYDGEPDVRGRTAGGRLHPHRRRRADRGRAATSPPPGSRSTTTRPTGPPTRSGSRSRAGWRRSPTASWSASRPRRRARSGTGRPRAAGAVPRDGVDRPVRVCAPTRSTGSSTGTRSTPTCCRSRSRAPAPATRSPGSAQPSLQAPDADDRRPRGRRDSCRSGSTATPSRAPTSSSSRPARPGADDWTTLPDREGHAARVTGVRLPGTLKLHPFLRHYQTADADGDCALAGHDGQPGGRRSGAERGYEQWTVDLARYAGRSVEVSLSYVERRRVAQFGGVYVDDVVVTGAAGLDLLRGRRRPARRLDRPRRAGRQQGQPERLDRGTVEQAPPSVGTSAQAALARQPEILDFLAGAVRAVSLLGRRLDRRRRPRPRLRAREPDAARSTRPCSSRTRRRGERTRRRPRARPPVGRRLAAGRRLARRLAQRGLRLLRRVAVERARRASMTAQAIFDAYARTPASRAGWRLKIGDPGPRTCSTRRSTRAAR